MAEATELDKAGKKAEIVVECRPTVFLALGGTGKEVLLRLRRRILQHTWNGVRLSSLSDFPIASFLYFDTDTRVARESDRAAITDPLAEAVQFSQSDTLQKQVDVAHYQREIRNYDYIEEWLPSYDLSRIDTSTGAGQVRAISRLLFFDIFTQFSSLLQAKAAHVLNNVTNDAALRRLGLKSEPALRVVVVGSTAGGTGAGSFIDAGYAARSMQTPKAAEVDLFLMLPGGYSGKNRERVFANTFASMMEMEHVMRVKRDVPYVSKWGQYELNRASDERPYNEVFLFDTVNLSQERTGVVGDLYDMVADILFEDFGNSEFASHKRSVAANQQQHKMKSYYPPLPEEFGSKSISYSRVFSTIGQCTVATRGQISLDSAVSEAGLGMIEAFFGITKNGKKNVPSPEARDEFLAKHLNLSVSAFEDYPPTMKDRPASISEYQLVNSLLMRPDGSSLPNALAQQLATEANGVTERFSDIKDWPREAENMCERRKIDVDGRPGSGDAYGPLGLEVVDARKRLQIAWQGETGENSLKALLYTLLDDHERGGLDYTIDLVEQVKARIDDTENGAIKRLSAAADEYSRQADFFLEKRYAPALARLREVSGSILFGGRKTATKILEQLGDDLRMHLTLRLRSIACREACTLLRDISSFLGERIALGADGRARWSGLIAEFVAGYDVVETALDFVRADVARLHDARDRRDSGMYFIIDDQSSQNVTVPKEDMLAWAKDAFESYKGSKKLFSTLRTPEGRMEVISQLQAIARQRLAGLAATIPSVTEVIRAMPDPERRELLGKALKRTMPWLDANFDRFRTQLNGDQFKLYIAVDKALDFQNEFGAEIKDLIPADFGISEAGFVNSGIAGRIVFYCELSGIPLDVITPLHADWRQCYQLEASAADGIPLHNHFDWMRFPNPVVPTNEEIQRLRADIDLFLRAIVFGILKRKPGLQANQPYYYEIRKNDPDQVGSERTIRKKLFDAKQRRAVEEMVQRFEETLTPLQTIAAAALFRYTADRAYAPRWEVFEADRGTRVGGLFHKVARDIEARFLARYDSTRTRSSDPTGDALIQKLFDAIEDWTVQVKGSVNDIDPLDGNLNPNESPELRAVDKRAIDPERFRDDVLAGYSAARVPPPPPPGANHANIPAEVSFYVADKGAAKGPFNGVELSAMARRGELTATTLVYNALQPGGQWGEAASVPVLAGLFVTRVVPPPPPYRGQG